MTAIFYSILQFILPCIRFFYRSNAFYLTIDDSPSEYTEEILDILDGYQAKACFFCIGKNVESYPDKFQEIMRRGHQIGYHSYDHSSNWVMRYNEIERDFEKSEELFASRFYRPPYGKISIRLLWYLSKKKITTVLWTIIMDDWKNLKDPTELLNKKVKKAPLGSIFVFHDNAKSIKNIKIMLPLFLQNAANKDIELKLLE